LTDSNSTHSQLQIEGKMVEISQIEPETSPFKFGLFFTKNNSPYLKLTFSQNVSKGQQSVF